jgi:hypothetical protein
MQPQPFRPQNGYPGFPPVLPPAGGNGFPIRWIARGILLAIGLPAAALVAWVIFTFERDKKKDLIAFDNRLDAAAEVRVDGKVVEKLEARHSGWTHIPVVKLPAGAKHIAVFSGGTLVSEVNLEIRPRAKGETNGYRGLYVVGPSRDYAIAKVPYYSETPKKSAAPQVTRIAAPAPLAELPRELESYQLSSIDGVFLDSESMPAGTEMVWKTELCSYELVKGKRTLGCSGFPGDIEP